MKRLHLFEFEDLAWFPNGLRVLMTRYINTIHKLLKSGDQIARCLADFFKQSDERHILDLCSGSGGPMPSVISILKDKHGIHGLRLTLSDLYPNLTMAKKINEQKDQSLSYLTDPVNALTLESEPKGLRTMICSLHHMAPSAASTILNNAQQARQPIFAYEISDNSFPRWLWWIAFPVNIISVLLITPLVRPVSWRQLLFTYLIPVLPIAIAWDGAVSNARTYTLEDLEKIIPAQSLPGNYRWEKGTLAGKGGDKIYLLGYPK